MQKILIILLLLLVIYISYNKYYIDNFDIIKREGLIYTDSDIIYKIYKMIYIVDRILNIYNIDYWMEGGTLLGALRHQGIIPWDEDADIQILDKDEYKLEELKPIFNKFGYSMDKTWWGYKIYPSDGIIIKDFNWKYPGLDIFVAEIFKDDDIKLRYKYPQAQERFSKCFSYYKDIYPLKRYKFGSFEINGPNNPYTYLNSCYGNDWYDIAYMEYNHEKEIPYEKNKIFLTDFDRIPALPFYP